MAEVSSVGSEPKSLLGSHHSHSDLGADLVRELAECRDFEKTQTDLRLWRVPCMYAGCTIAHGVSDFERRGGIETLGDDHAVVCPMLDDNRSLLGKKLRA